MKRRFAGLLAICLLLTAALTGCGDDGTGKGFRFPLDGEPEQLDPQLSADASSVTVISVLFEGLTRLDDDGNAVPGAADWVVSADGLTYTFTLRKSYWSTLSVRGAQTPWDEPTRVVADDFVFGLQRAVSPDTGSPLATALDGIVNARDIREGRKTANTLGVRAVGENTVIITLTAPDDRFPARLASPPFMPCNREFFRYTGGRYGLEKNYLLTNGAFTLAAWNHGDSLLLYKHAAYHDAAAVLPAAVRFVITPTDALASLQEGSMDAAALTADQLPQAAAAGIQLVELQDSVRGVLFNTADPVLNNASIRRALRDSIQWDTLAAYLEELEEPVATGYIAPDAVVSGTEIYRTAANARRPQTAVSQAQAAWGAGLQALYPDENSPALPSLTVLAAEDEASANLARYLIQSWQKNLKLYCSLQLVNESNLSLRLRTGSYQIALATTTASGLSGAENLRAYTTGDANNVTGCSDPRLDAAVAAALAGGREALTAAEQQLRDVCPSVPLSFPRRYYGIAARDEGVGIRPFRGGAYGSVFSFRQARKRGD